MWIRRKHYEHLFAKLSEAREAILKLERMDAAHGASVEWLRLHVNRLEAERGILTQERLALRFPVPVLEREDGKTLKTPEDVIAARNHEVPQGGIIGGIPVDETTQGVPDDSIALAQALGAAMEDVGDDAAGRLGIKHDALGQVVYTK